MVKVAIKRHEEMRKEVTDGSRQSLFRSRIEILKAKETKGGISAATWFLGGEVESVVTCQVTPGGKLAEELRKTIGTTKEGKRRLIQEEGGKPVHLGLKKSDPFAIPGCMYEDEKCFAKPGENCGSMGSIYTIQCKGCKEELSPTVRENPTEPGGIKSSHYIGLTAGSAHNRWKQHREGHERQLESNQLHNHDVEVHGGVVQEYEARVGSKEVSLLRLHVRESILQERQDPKLSMNDRIEMGRNGGLIRIATRTGVT